MVGTLRDANLDASGRGAPIPKSAVSGITLTLRDAASQSIVNGREDQNVLGTANCTLDATTGACAPLCPACGCLERLHAEIGVWCAGCRATCTGKRPATISTYPVEKYVTVRLWIRSGDAALVWGRRRVSCLISGTTKGPSHAGIILSYGGRSIGSSSSKRSRVRACGWSRSRV